MRVRLETNLPIVRTEDRERSRAVTEAGSSMWRVAAPFPGSRVHVGASAGTRMLYARGKLLRAGTEALRMRQRRKEENLTTDKHDGGTAILKSVEAPGAVGCEASDCRALGSQSFCLAANLSTLRLLCSDFGKEEEPRMPRNGAALPTVQKTETCLFLGGLEEVCLASRLLWASPWTARSIDPRPRRKNSAVRCVSPHRCSSPRTRF